MDQETLDAIESRHVERMVAQSCGRDDCRGVICAYCERHWPCDAHLLLIELGLAYRCLEKAAGMPSEVVVEAVQASRE